MKNQKVNVFLIEDDPMVQQINKQFIEKIEGFKIIGCASNGKEGIEFIKKHQPDLAFIDIFMPGQDGITTMQQIRSLELTTDIIAITAASDIETVRTVLQLGAVDYIMKPFKFERIKQALENYQNYHSHLHNKESISQKELDRLFSHKGGADTENIPKGLNALTLKKIKQFLQEQESAISAEKVAKGVGLARVTARRYLEYMEQGGIVTIQIEYGAIGRPVNRYIIS
ncbi:response regulator [Metabacillus herbersteinensis]|uniref:Response regulator n=1 Tax=Metabacillus herbersteinensis TaxID=283816 RepID=A0ABV6GCX5_9BACI